MRWQPQHEKASRVSGRISKLTFGLASIGTAILLLGWFNLAGIVAFGINQRIPILDLADEQAAALNIFQPISLIYLAVSCRICARFEVQPQNKLSFLFLSIGFVVLAVGEVQSLSRFVTFALTPGESETWAQLDISSHSIHINGIRSFLGTENPIAVITPLFFFPMAAGFALSGFLRNLPMRHAARFLVCGVVYVAGVLGMEAVSQVIAIQSGSSSISYLVTAGIEETLETLGILGFALALSLYMRERHPPIRNFPY